MGSASDQNDAWASRPHSLGRVSVSVGGTRRFPSAPSGGRLPLLPREGPPSGRKDAPPHWAVVCFFLQFPAPQPRPEASGSLAPPCPGQPALWSWFAWCPRSRAIIRMPPLPAQPAWKSCPMSPATAALLLPPTSPSSSLGNRRLA